MSSLSQPLNVLIADDDELILEMVGLLVETMGCRVRTAADGAEALELLRAEDFDVLISDWQMPRLNGIELVRAIRRERVERYLHIVMMTTRASERTVRGGLDVEVDDFLFKPVDPIYLEMGIASARRRVDLERRLARRNRHLAAANERTREAYRQIKTDLEAAAKTQRALLPPMSLEGDKRHGWLFMPALGIGGDTLDIRALADGRRFFFHLDISGHGIPAALRSFSLHHQISQAQPADAEALATLVGELNTAAQDDSEGAYYTMVCGLVSADGSAVDLIRAGHTMPMIVRDGTWRLVSEGDPPVGMLPNLQYSPVRVAMEPGDRLIIYSDGIIECENPEGEAYGEERLGALFAARPAEGLAAVIDDLEASLRQYHASHGFEDDVSLLVVERGPGQDAFGQT